MGKILAASRSLESDLKQTSESLKEVERRVLSDFEKSLKNGLEKKRLEIESAIQETLSELWRKEARGLSWKAVVKGVWPVISVVSVVIFLWVVAFHQSSQIGEKRKKISSLEQEIENLKKSYTQAQEEGSGVRLWEDGKRRVVLIEKPILKTWECRGGACLEIGR